MIEDKLTEKESNNIEPDTENTTIDSSGIIDEEDMVVADMSLVRKRRAFLPDRIRNEERLKNGGMMGQEPVGSRTEDLAIGSRESASGTISSVYGDLTPDQTKWAILGTLKAALLVGSAYAVGLGGLILILYLLFRP